MENVTYKMYKNNINFHTGTCPLMIVVNVLPLDDKNLYDYIEIIYKNKVITIESPKTEPVWK